MPFHSRLQQGFPPAWSTTNETGCTLAEPGNRHDVLTYYQDIVAFVPPDQSKDQAEDKEDPADDDESDTEPEETKVTGLGREDMRHMPTLTNANNYIIVWSVSRIVHSLIQTQAKFGSCRKRI